MREYLGLSINLLAARERPAIRHEPSLQIQRYTQALQANKPANSLSSHNILRVYRIIQRVHVHQWILLKHPVNLTQNTIVLLSRDVPSRPLTLRRVGATSTINPKINQPRTNINNMIKAPSKCHPSAPSNAKLFPRRSKNKNSRYALRVRISTFAG